MRERALMDIHLFRSMERKLMDIHLFRSIERKLMEKKHCNNYRVSN